MNNHIRLDCTRINETRDFHGKGKVMPVGVDDFKQLREKYYFVDKTEFIKKILDGHSSVTLLTRPRRFGKTLTLSMLYYFFTNEDAAANRHLFDGCEIAGAGEKYMAEQGTRPVIFFSLKDIKVDTWDSCLVLIKNLLADLYGKFDFLAQSEKLSKREKLLYQDISYGTASKETCMEALKHLTVFLEKHYGKKPLILIDEYDAPIQASWQYDYYDAAIIFFRNFFSAALKTNPALDFAILTGVVRISKESIFSSLNNLYVSSVIRGAYADVMGFTRSEVEKMAKDLGREEKIGEIRDWYDGYNFSGVEIYNPWSVINYFNSDCHPDLYWANTSANAILAEMLVGIDEDEEKELFELLNMGTIDTEIRENIVYSDIHEERSALYTMLLSTGYLKTMPHEFEWASGYSAVAIPNQEIRIIYAYEVLGRLRRMTHANPVRLIKSLLTGKAGEFSEELSGYLKNVASFYDTMKRESFYHGFMLGILALVIPQQYDVHSNVESGYGRFDLALFPKRVNRTGVVIEIKVSKTEDEMEKDAIAALKQIETKDYTASLHARGVKNVWKYGIAFFGKKLKLVRGEDISR